MTTEKYNVIPYRINENKTINVTQINEDVWLTQKQMAKLFDCSKENIRLHLKNIFKTQELNENLTTKKFLAVSNEGGKQVSREITHYNLDAIISVGYKVNSKRGVLFRQWATQIIRQRIIKERINKLNKLYKKTEQTKQVKPTILNISDDRVERAKIINEQLKLKGITQQDIGKALNFSYVTISKVVNGKVFNPIVEVWLKEHVFNTEQSNNNLETKAKECLTNAMNGDFASYKKIKALMRNIAVIHDFN